MWDELLEEFTYGEETTLELEHSLVSLSRWESKWNKSFLYSKNISSEESLDYIRCMCLDERVDPAIFNRLTPELVKQVTDYINASMTATTISESKNGKKNRKIVTAEVIYYWMISLNIPSEYEDWHLNRLITLIKVINAENAPKKKRPTRDLYSEYAAINEANKKILNTKG